MKRPCEIAETIVNGNFSEAKSNLIGRYGGSSKAGMVDRCLSVVEELIDTYGYEPNRAIDKVRTALGIYERGYMFDDEDQEAHA